MIDPVTGGIQRVGGSPAAPDKGTAAPASPDAFAAALRAQLEEVSQFQTEAGESVQKLLTGESQNMSEVFSAARKAEVAFSLLMEIRNKLVDAYSEIRQIRV
jgi:flagellar hook-basal body complex protein FliE